MDGYAFALEPGTVALKTYDCVGDSLAGHPFARTLSFGECIRITTGAEVPASANTVIIQENCSRQGNLVHIRSQALPGDNIRPPGHDISQGDVIVSCGRRLNAFDVSWLAACGLTEIEVTTKPRIAIFSTGDELLEPGSELGAGKIFDANRQVLRELLRELPVVVTDLGILPDVRERILDALTEASREHDVLLTTGGVSVGDADFVKPVVEEIGSLDLWRLNLKPGKPLAFGRIGDCLFFGLPGNPVSAIVTYLLIAQPALIKLCAGEGDPVRRYRACLVQPLKHSAGREEYQRGLLDYSAANLQVLVSEDQSSNRLASFTKADCLVRIPKDAGDLVVGQEVEILPFFGLY